MPYRKDTEEKSLEVRDAPSQGQAPPYYLQPVIYDQVHKAPQDKPKMSYQASLDELLIYKWEGYGRPYSTAGSLSSLSSFGHVDDLILSKELLNLAKTRGASESDSTISSASVSSITLTGDFPTSAEDHSGHYQPLYKDSWV